jgi:hypothetical protein
MLAASHPHALASEGYARLAATLPNALNWATEDPSHGGL